MLVRCQCGAVSFDTPSSAPTALYHCHCLECRRQSASAFGTSAIFPAAPLFPLSAALQDKLAVFTRPTDSPLTREMRCYFCKACGVRLMHRATKADGSESESVSIKGGCIEGLDWTGAVHIFTRSKVVQIPEGAEQYETVKGGLPDRGE